MTWQLPKAMDYAARAHANQRRKYTEEPYINHPIEVALLVSQTEYTHDMLCAAVLHDVVEDTLTTIQDIEREFGLSVSMLVWWLTDLSTPSDGNRAARKKIDRDHIAQAPDDAKTIKLADLISNTRTIAKFDPGFAKVYMGEKRLLLPVLVGGDEKLWDMAYGLVRDYYAIQEG